MKKCKNCQVTILDNTLVCPLCHGVLGAEAQEAEIKPAMYPNVKDVTRKLNFIMKLYKFLAIVIGIGLVIINYATFAGTWWCVISAAAILYFYFVLRYTIQKNSGYVKMILVQIIGGALLTIVVDTIIGYQGWSVNYVVPSAILAIDLVIIIFMIVNMANWQSYILIQILTILLSIMVLIFWKVGIITEPIVTIVAAGVSAVLFIGTLIFGDRKAKNELKRRFHM